MPKPLASAGRITAKGHRIVLDDDNACIEHEQAIRKVKMQNKGNVFMMRVKVMPNVADVKGGGDGIEVDVLFESEFPRRGRNSQNIVSTRL